MMPSIYLTKKELSALIVTLEDVEDETLRAILDKLRAKGEVAYLPAKRQPDARKAKGESQ